MSTIRILLGIFCLIAFGCNTKFSSGVLTSSSPETRSLDLCETWGVCIHRNDADRQRILTIARSQIGIREATGKNDGKQVEVYLRVTKLPKGNPWCAAFVSWVFKQAGFAQPRTPWSPALFPQNRRTTTPKSADVLGIYSIRLKRIAHAGIVEKRKDHWIISIEGNTNVDGSREGDGVYRKWRHIKTIAMFADWLKKE